MNFKHAIQQNTTLEALTKQTALNISNIWNNNSFDCLLLFAGKSEYRLNSTRIDARKTQFI